MQLQLIRSATLRIQYAGQQLLIDPYLAAKHTRPSFTGASLNPLVDLPCAPDAVIRGVEGVIISHLHSDHFDPAARDLLPKELPVLCQPEDQAEIAAQGFQRMVPVDKTLNWMGITITRTPCRHGSGSVLEEMGNASGFVFRAEDEPTIYWMGDTVWYEATAEIIAQEKPDIIITHSCGAMWGDHVLIVMDAAQTIAVCQAAPQSSVVAVHMEALDHATVTRVTLRAYAEAHDVGPEQLLIPADGEVLTF